MAATNVVIGIAGWSYEDWKEVVYPRGMKPGERLVFIARYFDCVEINSTFYANPRPAMAARWAQLVENRPDFLFTCKVNRSLTHDKNADSSALRRESEAFRSSIEPLESAGALGAVLAQFPWYFRFTPQTFDRVRALADLLGELPLVLEIRHRSFLEETFLDFLSERGIGLATIDLPASSTSLPETAYLFGPIGYFRFHGRNREAWFNPKAGRDQKYDYLYSENELRPWAARIHELSTHAERVFVIANNHFRGQAPANALDVAHLLGQIREVPTPLAATYPHLLERR